MTKPIHIRFGGAGGNYSYLLGVASILQKKFDLDDIKFSGASAGCTAAMLCALNIDIDNEFENMNIPMLQEIQTFKTKAFFNFLPTLKKHLLARLNQIPQIYKTANNKLFCNLTHVPSVENHLINKYNNNEDLVNCLMASGHIPLYNNCLFHTFRNKYYIDGCLTNNEYFDDKFTHIDLTHYRWRIIDNNTLFISSCDKFSNYLFELGKKDMINNISEFTNLLKLKN